MSIPSWHRIMPPDVLPALPLRTWCWCIGLVRPRSSRSQLTTPRCAGRRGRCWSSTAAQVRWGQAQVACCCAVGALYHQQRSAAPSHEHVLPRHVHDADGVLMLWLYHAAPGAAAMVVPMPMPAMMPPRCRPAAMCCCHHSWQCMYIYSIAPPC